MSRLDDTEAYINTLQDGDDVSETLLSLAAEVDELRGKLDDVRMGIGCARGQRTTQYCAEAAQRDEVITKLLATARDAQRHDVGACDAYRRACEITGRTE